MSQAEQIARFCSALIGGPDGNGDDRLAGQMVYVWTLPDKRTTWCRADEPGTLASLVLDAAGRQQQGIKAVYIGLGGVPEELAREKGWDHRPKADEVNIVPALCADIDIAGFGHVGKGYVPDLATALRILDACGLPPSVVVFSGYGIQAWWVFAEPFVISEQDDPEAARREIADLSRDWTSTLRFRADCMGGWKIDSVFDLSRVMRAPGTWNTKDPDSPKPVKILGEIDPNAAYEFDHFRELMAPKKVLDTYSMAVSRPGGSLVLKELPGVNLDELWARVTSEHYVARDYQPEWLETVLEFGPMHDKITATWEGNRPDLMADGNAYDAALVRLLHEQGLSVQLQVEALMCRRLRSGEKVDKVNPHKRVDYIVRTMTFVAASAAESAEKQDKVKTMRAADAAHEIVPPPTEEPPAPDPDGPGDPYTEYLEQEHAASIAPEPDATEHARGVIEQQQGIPPRPPLGTLPPREEPAPTSSDDPPPPPDDPPPVAEQPAEEPPKRPVLTAVATVAETPADPWGERNPNVVQRLAGLTEFLVPDEYRARGVEVWRLEHKDYGEAQRGRVVFRLPETFAWPANNPPKLYRVGKPLCSEWYKRDVFETPKGYRMALERDAMIPAQTVGNRKEDWATLISSLVSYWEADSSASDLASSAGDWLLTWLQSHAPTTEESEALDNARALLVSHKDWGRSGAPTIYMPKTSWLSYVATQPGGPTGRNGNTLLSYVHLIPRRPRLTGGDGLTRRVNWFEIAADQFEPEEWEGILETARQALEAREQRKLRAIAGGAS